MGSEVSRSVQPKQVYSWLTQLASTVEQILHQASIHAHSSYYNCVTISLLIQRMYSASKTSYCGRLTQASAPTASTFFFIAVNLHCKDSHANVTSKTLS